MRDYLINLLVEKCGYKKKVAEITADDLMATKDKEIKEVIAQWITSGKYIDYRFGETSVFALMEKRDMKYPAALIYASWYKENPEEAIKALSYMN